MGLTKISSNFTGLAVSLFTERLCASVKKVCFFVYKELLYVLEPQRYKLAQHSK